MAKQTINIGTSANDRTGDPLRTAFQKTNANFTELYTAIDNVQVSSNTQLEYLELTSRYSLGAPVTFAKVVGVDEEDEIDTGLVITRDARTPETDGGGIYNSAVENDWNPLVSPVGLLWNWDGWGNLDNVKTRQYVNLRQALKNRIGENIVGAELVAHDTINNKYYTFLFTEWAQGAQHDGNFAYTRRLISASSQIGITFADGSNLVSAPEKFYGYPQTYVGDTSGYTLVLDDAGKHVYAFGVTITIPNRSAVDFPIGSTVKVVAENQPVTISAASGVSISSASTISEENGTWIIPANAIATLIKTRQGTDIRPDVWRLDSVANKAWSDSSNQIFNIVEWNSGINITITATPFETANAVTYDSRTDSEYIYFVWDQDFIDNVWEGWNTPQGEGQSYSVSLDGGITWIPVETSGYNGGTFFYFWIPNEFRENFSFNYDIGQSAIIRYNRGSNPEVWFDLENAPVPADKILGVNMNLVINATVPGDPDRTANVIYPRFSFMNVLYNDNTSEGSINRGARLWSGSNFVSGQINVDLRKIDDPADAGRIYANFDDGVVGTMSIYWNATLYTLVTPA